MADPGETREPMSDEQMGAVRAIGLALDAAHHIAECGDHPEHLRDAEQKARAAGSALDLLANDLASCRAVLTQQEAGWRELSRWLVEHLDELPTDLDAWDEDTDQIVASMRAIVTGNLGCTEQDDYTRGQWQVLQLFRAALADGAGGSLP